MNGIMNNTKWNEVRLAMYNLPYIIKWRTKDAKNGYISNWDVEWYYHFMIGGYKTIEWLEIELTQETKESVLNELKKIHVPAEVLESSVKVYGYKDGNVDYL
jgi:hypothetical protein